MVILSNNPYRVDHECWSFERRWIYASDRERQFVFFTGAIPVFGDAGDPLYVPDPAQDRPEFWDCAAEKIESPDRELLDAIVQCLQKDTSDFYCIEKIPALLEARGFSTSPRHDFC